MTMIIHFSYQVNVTIGNERAKIAFDHSAGKAITVEED